MKIILTEQCESFTGSLGRGFGYHIQRRKNGFFAKRNTKGDVPPSGHIRFIIACAEQAHMKLHIADIKVTNRELFEALREANLPSPAFLNWNNVEIYSAKQVLDFAKEHKLEEVLK